MDNEEKGKLLLFILVFTITFGSLVGIMVYNAMAREKCLDMGFPKHTMTWNLRVFCLGYDGALHPVVKESK